jgi:opacity protein-like surface antigen
MMVVLAVAGMSVAAPASAQYAGRGAGWEFGVDAVYLDGADIDFEGGSQVSTDDELGFTLTFGYRFNPHLELQFAFDWTVVDYDARLQSALVPALSIPVTGELEAVTPRVNVNYNFLPGAFTPYVTGGIGWSFIDTNIPNSQVEVGCWWDPWYGQICAPYQSTQTSDEFTYQAGVGVRWDFSRGFSMRLGYEKHWYDYSNATSTPDFDQLKLGVTFIY